MNPRPNKPSPFLRWARIVLWTTFAVVVFSRYIARWGTVPPPRPAHAQFTFEQPRERYRRAPDYTPRPVGKIPDDFWRIQIEIAERDVDVLRDYQWNGWRGARVERQDVKATVREGGTVYTNVALHLKGAAGSFRPFDHKPALTLNFSKNAPGQKFHGYSKISLNNSVQDPSYLCEIITREMFEAAGVPVPRAGHATVLINGRDLGLYVYTEGFGKTFLKRHFKDVSGNLYDSGFCQEITQKLDTNSGDHPEDQDDLRQLAAAANGIGTNSWLRLNQLLDMPRFISFLAMEAMTVHWDGYMMNRNNYRVFHDAETDRMIFMPHGLDQMFGWPQGRSGPRSGIDPNRARGLVASAVLSHPEGHKLFWDRIASLRTNVFKEAELVARVDELAARLKPTLAAYGQDGQIDWAVNHLRDRIKMRAETLSEQLASPPPSLPQRSVQFSGPLSFDQQGVAKLNRWTSRITQQAGGMSFDRPSEMGKPLLRIRANQGGGAGSWRMNAVLSAGRYRFEGMARTQGASNGGVSLRISGLQTGAKRIEGRGWVPLSFPIEISEGVQTVELVCEFSGPSGEASFDQSSLRLVRE